METVYESDDVSVDGLSDDYLGLCSSFDSVEDTSPWEISELDEELSERVAELSLNDTDVASVQQAVTTAEENADPSQGKLPFNSLPPGMATEREGQRGQFAPGPQGLGGLINKYRNFCL